ncbi:hypothetical protein Tsubulata_037764 [Turnera subulata]|uniref:Uncharacterized protein n=1 Tax=Turnera subulata TaxID=218843 RepID=A0A9Q0GB98_9ROSI|nr:hypothetical protein Tsubulata_037764 [Turnera subulata]
MITGLVFNVSCTSLRDLNLNKKETPPRGMMEMFLLTLEWIRADRLVIGMGFLRTPKKHRSEWAEDVLFGTKTWFSEIGWEDAAGCREELSPWTAAAYDLCVRRRLPGMLEMARYRCSEVESLLLDCLEEERKM